MPHIPTLKSLRLRARMSQAQLARAADIDAQTVARAENGYFAQDVKCAAIVQALNATETYKSDPIDPEEVTVDGGEAGPMPKKGKTKAA